MYPDKDKPFYHAGFLASIGLQVTCIVTFLCIPALLLLEAKQRIKKTGHAMPLRAMQDAENAQVSEATMARIHDLAEDEEAKAIEGKVFEANDAALPVHMETVRSSPKSS